MRRPEIDRDDRAYPPWGTLGNCRGAPVTIPTLMQIKQRVDGESCANHVKATGAMTRTSNTISTPHDHLRHPPRQPLHPRPERDRSAYQKGGPRGAGRSRLRSAIRQRYLHFRHLAGPAFLVSFVFQAILTWRNETEWFTSIRSRASYPSRSFQRWLGEYSAS